MLRFFLTTWTLTPLSSYARPQGIYVKVYNYNRIEVYGLNADRFVLAGVQPAQTDNRENRLPLVSTEALTSRAPIAEHPDWMFDERDTLFEE